MEDNTKVKQPDINTNEMKDKEIDILALIYTLWSKRKVILIWCMWGVLAGLIIAFSIPREYSTKVKLAPEVRSRTTSLSGSLGALASMAGISANLNSGTDAFYPQLYPEIVSSIPFIMSLTDVQVKDKKDKEYTVKDYLIEETKAPWWGYIISAPRKLIGIFTSQKADLVQEEALDSILGDNKNFRLTKEDDFLVKNLRRRIKADVDQKTNVITISVDMQDPVASAILADTVVSRLREFVTNYRTDKARKDLDYAQKINTEAQQEYYEAQQRLADYIDRNQNIATQSARVSRDRLENEASLAFNLYNETSLQVQNAKSRVQETTPVFTEITPATVPLRPTSPRKGLILAGFTFLAFAGSCAWILFGTPILEEYKKKVKEIKEKDSPSDKKSE